jgi:hypothetical protein
VPTAAKFIWNIIQIGSRSSARKAEWLIQSAMQVHYVTAAGPLVQVIHVLGNQ